METSITWSSETKEWSVWTDNPAHVRKIERTFSIKPYRVDVQEGYSDGAFFKLPSDKYRPFSAKRSREMTDEQRAELRERLARSLGREIDDDELDEDDVLATSGTVMVEVV